MKFSLLIVITKISKAKISEILAGFIYEIQ